MALINAPGIVTNGLIYYHDIGNAKKSWLGAPTTNQFTLPSTPVNGFGIQNSTFTRIYSGTYGGYTIQPSDYVWQYNISTVDCPYHGWDIPTTIGTVVTFSFDYYVSPTTAGYPVTNYIANMENVGSGVSGAYGDPTPYITGVWKRGYFSGTATATGNTRCLLYPGACSGQLGTSGFILYKNPQVEFNVAGGIPTPFVAGTRSTTQSILDLTANNTVTVNSLTYSSDSSFSFNGTSNSLTVPFNAAKFTFNNEQTIIIWMKNSSPSAARRNPYNQAYGGGGTITHENDTAFNYYFGTAGTNTTPYSSITSAFTVVVGETAMICLTRNTSTITWYKNGAFSNSIANPYGVLTTGVNDITIGSGYAGAFGGNLYTVQVYNRCLTADEVAQNFNAIRRRYGL